MERFIKFVVAGSLLVSGTAGAFDGNRSGFFIGLGAGFQNISIDDIGTDSSSASGLASSFKIGGGLTDQFSLYYVRNASWFEAADGSADFVYTAGIAGFGATYYMKPNSPSGYVLGAVGSGDYGAPFASNIGTSTGSAYMFGVGYELSDRNMIEATFVSTEFDSFDNQQSTLNSFQLTYNYMWY